LIGPEVQKPISFSIARAVMKALKVNTKHYTPERLESIREWPKAQRDRSTARKILHVGKPDPDNPKLSLYSLKATNMRNARNRSAGLDCLVDFFPFTDIQVW
jgi:hypothetical protein